ncbi:MAG TPA: sigma-70 family RNA polymerase sigma factor [Pirellulales bacterium]|nr:sigma-70 family RNA polymerase sigma factor [Pirellulales bacterium]
MRKVQRRIEGSLREYVLIYSCDAPAEQFWQWAIPQRGHRRRREHTFLSCEPPATFVSLLGALRFSADERPAATIADVRRRVRAALNAAREEDMAANQLHERGGGRAPTVFDVDAFRELVVQHLPLARQLSKWVQREFGVEPDEAEQIGVIGLLEAARRFRPERGVAFAAYGNFWVREACRRFGRQSVALIRLPENVLASFVPFQRRLEQMTLQSGPARANEEWLCRCLTDEKFFQRWLGFERALNVRSLSDRREPEYREARNLAATWTDPIEDEERQERAAALRAAIDSLAPREGRLLRLRHGIDGAPQSLGQIGTAEGITRERVRQIVARAEKRLRRLLAEQTPEVNDGERDERRQNREWLGQYAHIPLNVCQRAALLHLRRSGQLTFYEYQMLYHADQFAARQELCGLERSGLVEKFNVSNHWLFRLTRDARTPA